MTRRGARRSLSVTMLCMHPKETRDVVEVCCRQRIPAQLMFAGAHQPADARFAALDGDALWIEPTSPLPPLTAGTSCTICFQQATSTLVLLTTLLDAEAGQSLRFAMPTFAVIARGRQFFRVPVAEANRLLAMLSEDEQHWYVGSPMDLSMGGLQVALFEAAPNLVMGSRVTIELVLERERACLTGRIVRRVGSKLGVQLIGASGDTRDAYREIVKQVERRWLSTVFEVQGPPSTIEPFSASP